MAPPKFSYCFTNSETGMTLFDPFRFMLRRAYAEGTDLRLFVTPAACRGSKTSSAQSGWINAMNSGSKKSCVSTRKKPRAPNGRHSPCGTSAIPSTITSEPIPAAGRPHADAMVLGSFALPPGGRRSHPRPHLRLQRAHAPSSRRFRRSTDREEHRCAPRKQQSQARRLDRRQHRIGVTDYQCCTRPETQNRQAEATCW